MTRREAPFSHTSRTSRRMEDCSGVARAYLIVEEVAGSRLQGGGDLLEGRERRVHESPLDPAEVGTIQPGLGAGILLRQADRLPQGADAPAELPEAGIVGGRHRDGSVPAVGRSVYGASAVG